MQVLIADASPLIHECIGSLLADLDDVTIAGCAVDADRAEAMVAARSPDVLIVDASLPGGGCRRLLQRLASRSGDRRPIAIVLANPASAAYRQRLQELGAAFVFDTVHEMDRLAATFASLQQRFKAEP
jgi:DNA-binding NarL/FixJ family response regulator